METLSSRVRKRVAARLVLSHSLAGTRSTMMDTSEYVKASTPDSLQ